MVLRCITVYKFNLSGVIIPLLNEGIMKEYENVPRL